MTRDVRNPFLGRTPVECCEFFYGRRDEARILVSLFGSEVPQSCALIGKRRIGKTSLANFATHPQGGMQEFAGLLAFPAEAYLFVSIDLELLHVAQDDRDGKSRLDAFRYIFTRLHQAAQARLAGQGREAGELAGLFDAQRGTSDFNELVQEGIDPYLELLGMRGLVTVLILDEADNMIALGVGGTLRALIGSRRLAYIIITRSPMQDIDPERTSSPLYNLCMPLQVGLLDEKAAAALVTEPAQRAGCPFTAEQVRFILQTGGRHPEFLKVAARHVFDAFATGGPVPPLSRLYPRITWELDASCGSLWQSLTPEQQTTVARIAAAQPLPRQGTPSINALADQGILAPSGGEPKLFSPVFADYVARQTVEPAPSAAASVLQTGLVFANDHFTFEGSPVPATQLELRILRYLYEHAGQACPRKEIYEFAWQEGTYSDVKEATVNIAVQRLRNKLRAYLSSRLVIESIRGQGYRLTA
jgi:hypothetical protein